MKLVKSLNTSVDIVPKTEPKSECGIDGFSNTNVQKYNSKIKNENYADQSNEFNFAEVESINRIESDYYLIVAQVILNSPESLFKVPYAIFHL